MGLNRVNVTIGGEAGQGLVTVGELLARCLSRCGYGVMVTQSYMSRIRGGHNTYTVSASVAPLSAALEEIDVLVALNAETVSIHQEDLAPGALVVMDGAIEVQGERRLRVPFKDLAEARYHNIVALGVVGAVLGLDRGIVAHAVEAAFGKKKPEMAEQNIKALEASYGWTLQQPFDGYRLAQPPKTGSRLFMNGNEAIALGALTAGVKFCAFYPMTPATSICLSLASWARKAGIIVEQAEDEIAAINMALGASYTGAPSMVATSGGGFALMTEGVSLAAMTELPLVIVVAQRPGPATGLPTRTEQGDLEMVLHAGHGEFPRAIFAPGTTEECFHLTRKAFQLAEGYQSPVFVLTDQYLADRYTEVADFDLESFPPIQVGVDPGSIEMPYKRYKLTESGVSPRLLPGRSEHLVIVDSDEHCEMGHITEDLGVRKQMMDKRLRKLEGIVREVVPPEYEGEEDCEMLLVSWGSSKGAVLEAAQKLRERGESVAVLHFAQVWPLRDGLIRPYFQSARETVGIEGNATGQFTRLLRRETGIHIPRLVLRYDGLPITSRYILETLGKG